MFYQKVSVPTERLLLSTPQCTLPRVTRLMVNLSMVVPLQVGKSFTCNGNFHPFSRPCVAVSFLLPTKLNSAIWYTKAGSTIVRSLTVNITTISTDSTEECCRNSSPQICTIVSPFARVLVQRLYRTTLVSWCNFPRWSHQVLWVIRSPRTIPCFFTAR